MPVTGWPSFIGIGWGFWALSFCCCWFSSLIRFVRKSSEDCVRSASAMSAMLISTRLLEHLLELLRRDRRGLLLVVALVAELHQELHDLGLEVAAEVDGRRALVGHRLAVGHLDVHVLAEGVGGHGGDVHHLVVDVDPVVELLVGEEVGDLLGEAVEEEGGLGGVFDGCACGERPAPSPSG